MKTAYFENRKVIVLCERSIPDGTAVDIVKHPEEQDWPWTIVFFTTSMDRLEFDSTREKILKRERREVCKTY